MLFQGQAMLAYVEGQCRKDLFLIVDTSVSITSTNFNEQIKPFINQLLNAKALNVGKEGTHIALMVFSKDFKTKMLIDFGQVYDKDALSSIIDKKLDWKTVSGGHTRTDIALQMANEQIFSSKSPANHRKTVDDVIVIITDGEPYGVSTAIEDTKKYAQKLKSKGITIIGIGVGPAVDKYWHILQDIASPGQAIKAKFSGIRQILGKLVSKSCENYSGFCTCPSAYGLVYLKPGETKRMLSWEEPTPSCRTQDISLDTTRTIVNPPLNSPHGFEAGKHSISYTYVFKNAGGNKTCSVDFEIKACLCPPVNLGSLSVEQGASTRKVSWQLPQPQPCRASLKAITPQVKPGDSFPIGPHTVNYVFKIERDFDVTCTVNFEVAGTKITLCRGKPFSRSTQECCCGAIHEKQTGFRCCGIDYYETSKTQCCPGANVRGRDQSCFGPACKCPSMPFSITYIKPRETNARVRWQLPRPNCQSRLVSVDPSVSPGEAFSVGLYKIKYSYRIYDRYVATCRVNFEVKECKCPLLDVRVMSVKPGDSMMKVRWTEPLPGCSDVARKISEPQQKPGEAFTIGRHHMRYVYNINNQFQMMCAVSFQIKGALCRDRGYDVTNQECCCGTIYNKDPGFRCCGQDYYDASTKRCCPNSVVRDKDVACPTE